MATVEEILATQEAEKQAKLNVKPGDKWFRFIRFNDAEEVEVTKVTKTQIAFSDGDMISRTSGNVIGSGRFNRTHYRPATDALKAELDQEYKDRKAAQDLQDAITRIQTTSSALNVDKKIELTNLINGFFDSL